jgi:hypothetical protein
VHAARVFKTFILSSQKAVSMKAGKEKNSRRSIMKTIKIIIGLIIVCFIASVSLTYASGPGSLRVKYLQGSALVKADNTTEWVSVLMNMPLMEGDEIRVPEYGRMEIQTSEGSFLRVDEGSSFGIHSVYENDYRMSVTEGRVYIHFQGEPDSSIRIETPGSFVRASREATFSIDVDDTGPLALSVFRGTVYAAGNSEMIRVRAGETLILAENYYADITRLGPSDEWERWNRDRDERFEERVYSARYLPDELKVYSSDLDDHGEWVYVRNHGYVWKPYVIGVSGWSPYRVGKWAWFDDDYVWVSYEPWGWAPYHYGRWAFTVSTGWFWVPPARGVVYWSPGYVGWIRTPSYVAWVPLAPGDIYYAYGHYGPGSVNIINININIHNKLKRRMYRNIPVDRAVIAVHRDSFSVGRYKKYKAKENPFIRFIRPDRSKRHNEISFLPFNRKTKPDPRLHIDAKRYRGRPAYRVDASLKKTRVVQKRERELARFAKKKTKKVVQKRNVPEYADREYRQARQPDTKQALKKYRTTERNNGSEKKYYKAKIDRKQKAYRVSPARVTGKRNILKDIRTKSVRKAQQVDSVDKNYQRQGKGNTAFISPKKNKAGMRRTESRKMAHVDFYWRR